MTDLRRNNGAEAIGFSGHSHLPFDELFYAAAGLILTEAGGVIRNCDGGEISLIKGGSVLCASEETMEKISRMAAET